jgi:hypothetical protein
MKLRHLCLVIFAANLASAQMPTKPELLQAYRDADYVFKQFDELTVRVDFSAWKTSQSAVNGAKSALNGVRTLRIKTGTTLSELYSAQYTSPVDLLDLMSTVTAVGEELDELGHDVLDFMDENTQDTTLVSRTTGLAEDLTRASALAQTNSAALYALTRRVLVLQEQAVLSCAEAESKKKKGR